LKNEITDNKSANRTNKLLKQLDSHVSNEKFKKGNQFYSILRGHIFGKKFSDMQYSIKERFPKKYGGKTIATAQEIQDKSEWLCSTVEAFIATQCVHDTDEKKRYVRKQTLGGLQHSMTVFDRFLLEVEKLTEHLRTNNQSLDPILPLVSQLIQTYEQYCGFTEETIFTAIRIKIPQVLELIIKENKTSKIEKVTSYLFKKASCEQLTMLIDGGMVSRELVRKHAESESCIEYPTPMLCMLREEFGYDISTVTASSMAYYCYYTSHFPAEKLHWWLQKKPNLQVENDHEIVQIKAMKQATLDSVKLIFENPTRYDVNRIITEWSNSETMMTYAIMNARQVEIIEYLLEQGSDVNFEHSFGNLLGQALVKYKDDQVFDVMELLLKYNPLLAHAQGNYSPVKKLMYNTHLGNESKKRILTRFVELGVDILETSSDEPLIQHLQESGAITNEEFHKILPDGIVANIPNQ
jgi:hypothetical protein